ncbi:MAG: hypothetical protein Q8O89_03045 [Nanoarchaeota archaeon]|nr:hypothetical protein [Nanoarchaeota archaeon]
MLTDELLKRGGGKLEATRLFLENELDIPIPKSVYLYAGQNLDSIKSEIEKMKTPLIVRSSHRNDYHGLVGALPTISNVTTFSQLESAVKQIEKFMKNPELKKFMQDEKEYFDREGITHESTEEVHCLIQEQSPSNFMGVMMRHPHNADEIIIRYCDSHDRTLIAQQRDPISQARFNDIQGLRDICAFDTKRPFSDNLRNLVEVYKKIESSKLLEKGWSYQMEFGINPDLFYQIRPFKKIEKANFSIYSLHLDCPRLETSYAFGITPKEGIKIPVIALHGDSFKQNVHARINDISKEYGVVLQKKMDGDELPLDVSIGNLHTFFTSAGCFDMFHGSTRLIKRAKISGAGYSGEGLGDANNWESFPEKLSNYNGDAQIISDGKSAVLIPLNL